MIRSSLRCSTSLFLSRNTPSITTSIRSLSYVAASSNTSSSQPPIARRQTGRGSKKTVESYLICNGVRYPGNEDTLASAKAFLGSEYEIPDSLILQALTHKSFAHGLKPYNENLAIIGRHFLRLQTISHAASMPSENPAAINGTNFDVVLARICNLMSATPVTSRVGRLIGLDKSIFWRSPAAAAAENNDGSAPSIQPATDLVVARTVDAFVGAVLMNRGQYVAQKFVKERLLDGPYSLVNVSKEIYE